MDKLRIIGGTPLSGTIRIGGAKNAALPLMAATLLTKDIVTLNNVPFLADITTLAKLLSQHGVALGMGDSPAGGRQVTLQAADIHNLTAPYDIVRTMRASILVLGPLLARFGEAKVSLPGGCAIGSRPVDLHLKALEEMGAEIAIEEGYVIAKAPQDGLYGAEIHFEVVSVGATENALMAATLANGTTVLSNAAREPEITDLAHMLVAMGAKIEGIGTATLTIEGVGSLHGTEHTIVADRIEAGSYLSAVAVAGGSLRMTHAAPETMGSTIERCRHMGLEIEVAETEIWVKGDPKNLQPLTITTQPYPGFATDMQAQMMTALTQADGTSVLTETIFENRFMHVPELNRLGADIHVNGRVATINGASKFKGAEVMATDLRASVSLVIAALAAEGETVVNRIYHLDRGYERLEEKLTACGANIERIH